LAEKREKGCKEEVDGVIQGYNGCRNQRGQKKMAPVKGKFAILLPWKKGFRGSLLNRGI
jgi:hypothetical protein